MAVFCIEKRLDFLLRNPQASEVVQVFESLFSEARLSLLPWRALVMPYTDKARYSDFKDNARQRGLGDGLRRKKTVLAGDQGRTYGDVFLEEISQINDKLPGREQELVVDAVPPEVAGSALASLPPRMWCYANWIRADFILLLKKRLALGPNEGLLEDLFRTYAAGYFSFGWSGTFPHDVRLLVFPGCEADEGKPASKS